MHANYTESDFLEDLDSIVKENPQASQREIGSSIGISVGLVNEMIKKCMARGWIAVKNLSLKKLQYMLTAQGMQEITRRSKSFVKRNFETFNEYSRNLSAYILKAKADGKCRVVLVGPSKLQFLLEWACVNAGVAFDVANAPVAGDDVLNVLGDVDSAADGGHGFNGSAGGASGVVLADVVVG